MPQRRPSLLVCLHQIFQAGHHRAFRFHECERRLVPSLPPAHHLPALAQRHPGSVVELADRPFRTQHLELPAAGRHAPGFHSVLEDQLVRGPRVGRDMAPLDPHIARQQFPPHSLDPRIPQQIGDRVDRVDVPVQQARRREVHHRLRLADIPSFDRLLHHLVAVVEPAQHPGVEQCAALVHRLTRGIGLVHGTGHRLFHVEHGHPGLGQADGQIRVRVSAKARVRSLVGRFQQPRSRGADGHHVRLLLLDHLQIILVKRLHSPPLAERLPLLFLQISAGRYFQPFAGLAGRGDRIRQFAVAFVIDRATHAAQADNTHAIRLHLFPPRDLVLSGDNGPRTGRRQAGAMQWSDSRPPQTLISLF